MMPYGYKTPSVRDLEKLIDKKSIALPDFQRAYVWGPDETVSLLTTVFRDWPAGTLLLLEGPQAIPTLAKSAKAVEGGPKLESTDSLEFLALDGQQRITSLYRAIGDRDRDYVFFVDLKLLGTRKEFNDESVKWMRQDKFPATLEEAAKERWVKISEIYDRLLFDRWLKALETDIQRERATETYERHLEDLPQYQLPANTLKTDQLKLPAIVRIFTRLNREGLQLDTFDMLVALVTPTGFDLRKAAEDLEAEVREIIRGLDADKAVKALGLGMATVQIAALQERERQRAAGDEITIEGIRESDLISLIDEDPSFLKRSWAGASAALIAALEFVRDECGATHRNVLPPMTLIEVLAVALSAPNQRPHWSSDLRNWVWAAWFGEEYVQGTNTKALSDATQLMEWNAARPQKPAIFTQLTQEPATVQAALHGPHKGHAHFRSALMAMLIAGGAKDWLKRDDGSPAPELRDHENAIQAHHIFPEAWIRDMDPTLLNQAQWVVNFSPLTARTNQRIGKQAPSHVAKLPLFEKETLASHKIDKRLFEEDLEKFKNFRTKRTRELLEQIASVTGIEEIGQR
jgi:hypothetical protein